MTREIACPKVKWSFSETYHLLSNFTKYCMCDIISGAQPFEVIWLHNDKEIKKNDPVYKMLSNGNVHSLIIQEVRIFIT